VKWELPSSDKTYVDVGKLKIPEFKQEEKKKEEVKVGKLKWGGFTEQEPANTKKKPVEKDIPTKPGKLNAAAMFGGDAAAANPEPAKKSWKKT
jgi:hypothetical protein